MPARVRSAQDIQIADRIEIHVTDLETGETKKYLSSVQNLADAGIAVSMPLDGRISVPVREGQIVGVSILKGNADYYFKSRVLQKIGGSLPQLVLSPPAPGDITSTLRREHIRVETDIPAKLQVFGKHQQLSLEGRILDLSANGCRLQLDRRIPPKTFITLDFDLPFPSGEGGVDQTRPLRQISGQVKTAPRIQSRGKHRRFLLGVEFALIPNVVRSYLLRYVTLLQRALLEQLRSEAENNQWKKTSTNKSEEALEVLERELKELEAEPQLEEPSALPLPDEVPAAPEVPLLRPPAQESGKTILIVEDEEDLRLLLAESLQIAGHTTVEAADGQEALDLVRQTAVDLIITDLMMPRMNGWRLLAALRSARIEMPVVIITGYMYAEGQEVLTSKDISGFLVKPVDLEKLNHMVRRILFPDLLGRRTHILAVDDEEDMLHFLSTQLGNAGFEVETSSSGREAFEKLEWFKPDLVLLDIAMPQMDGFEVCRRLRFRPATSRLPVIMLTAKTSVDYVRQAMALKVSGYIAKPFDTETLVTRIRRVLQTVGQL